MKLLTFASGHGRHITVTLEQELVFVGVERSVQYDIYESSYRIMGDNLGGRKQVNH
jgi:hypothetical protein